jgi:hypothetical protein
MTVRKCRDFYDSKPPTFPNSEPTGHADRGHSSPPWLGCLLQLNTLSSLGRVGQSVKRHATWAVCERRVKGVPGARFKKTKSAQEEAQVLEDWGVKAQDVQAED